MKKYALNVAVLCAVMALGVFAGFQAGRAKERMIEQEQTRVCQLLGELERAGLPESLCSYSEKDRAGEIMITCSAERLSAPMIQHVLELYAWERGFWGAPPVSIINDPLVSKERVVYKKI